MLLKRLAEICRQVLQKIEASIFFQHSQHFRDWWQCCIATILHDAVESFCLVSLGKITIGYSNAVWNRCQWIGHQFLQVQLKSKVLRFL